MKGKMNRTAGAAIPFLDLVTPHQELREELMSVFASALDTAGFIGGPMIEAFEREFAAFCDVHHCVGVGSGTDALRFALIAAGVRSGDVVITVPNTFIATAEAITQAGAVTEFVDIDEQTYNLDPEKLREYLENQCDADQQTGRRISRKTGCPVTAVVPVHLYGQMADMDAILEIADSYKLAVIEDACQAHGAEYFSKKSQSWRKAGSMGRAAAFSFYPGKNLGACGEAGAVTTNDPSIAAHIRMIRDHGQPKKYYHDIEGYNGRLDAIQAGLLRVKLAHLAKWNERRRERARDYRRLFEAVGTPVIVPYAPPWSRAVFHLYVIRTRDRDGLMNFLKENNIGTGIHYPIPLHLQKAYKSLNYERGSLSVCERVADEILSLPMFPHLAPEQQTRVVEETARFIATARAAKDITGGTEDLAVVGATA